MGFLQALFGQKPMSGGVPPFAGASPMTGGAMSTPAPGEQQHGLSGFLDRLANPTNALGQIGQALLIGGGGPLGDAAQVLMKQAQDRKPKLEHVGDSYGWIDPRTGSFTPTYTAPKSPTGYAADLQAEGVDPNSDAGRARLHNYNLNREDPIVNYVDPRDGTHFVPRSMLGGGGMPGALGVVPQGTLGATNTPAVPPQAALDYLKANPDQASAFDQKYGPGALQRYLGGAASQGAATFPMSRVMGALTQQESGGDGTARSYKGALGSTQMLPGTAKEMAAKLGLPFRPDLLQSNDPSAIAYQQQLGQAYFQQGLDTTGNLRDALRYYHGGPNRSQWGPKTNAYARSILANLGGMN